MELTSDTETRQTTMTVTVRVPNGADGDLTTNVQRRLSRADGVLAVTVEELRELQPGLSGTDVSVRVTFEMDGERKELSGSDTLAALTGVEIVDPSV
jgi:uncharacterized protein YcnI